MNKCKYGYANDFDCGVGYTHAAWIELDDGIEVIGLHGSQVGPYANPAPTGIFEGWDGTPKYPDKDGYVLEPGGTCPDLDI